MRSLLSLGLGAMLALVYSPLAAGQAIIGYGINTGRAATAGAAAGSAGAGAAGIFRRLKGTLDAKTPSRASTAQQRPEFDKDDPEKSKDTEATSRDKPVFKSSGEIKTKSGVKISGLTPVTGPRRWAEPESEPGQAWVPMPPGPASTLKLLFKSDSCK